MISRIERSGAPSPSEETPHLKPLAKALETELTAYVAALANLNVKNLEAQIASIAHRTIELLPKAQEAKSC